MKSLKYYTSSALFCLLLFTQSCSLDETLTDTPTPGSLSTDADITAVIKGLYSQLNDSGAFKFLGHIMLTITADDIYSTSGAEYAPYAQRTLTSTNTASFWNRLYSTAANASALLDGMDNLKASDALKKRAAGEAYFIRGFCYYYLVRLYGGVPLRISATTATSDFYLPRASVDQVYAQIFADFKAASVRLPLQTAITSTELGRASKGSAQAMLAHASLTYGNMLALKGQSATTQYQDALLYADSVINSNQYSLQNNYGDLFDITKEDGMYTTEVIFGIRFQTDASARAQPAAGSEFAVRFGASNTHRVSGNPPSGAGDNTFRISHWFADYYRKGDYGTGTGQIPNCDYRNEKAFFVKGYNTVQAKYYSVYPNLPATTAEGTIVDPLCAKYIDPNGKDARNNGNDFYIIRYAEIYLIKAEAENELNGNTAVARTAFNMVRARARKTDGSATRTIPADITSTTLTKDEFRMKIFDERGLELVGEGQRWFDLVRMRSPLSPTQTMYEYQFKTVLSNIANFPRTFPTYNTTTKKFTTTNAVYAPMLNVTVPKFLLFPIPATEITQNPNFGPQNTGW